MFHVRASPSGRFHMRSIKSGRRHTAPRQELFEEIWSLSNLRRAFDEEKRRNPSPGWDRQDAARFEQNLYKNLKKLRNEIHQGRYEMHPLLEVRLPGQKKPVCILTFRDRLLQRAVHQVLQPLLEGEFCETSFAFRPGRSIHMAQQRVLELAQCNGEIRILDIKDYFDSICHQRLSMKLLKLIRSLSVADLIERTFPKDRKDSRGLSRGAILSPLLSNVYLNAFDHHMAKQGPFLRYCDDIVVLSSTRSDADSLMHAAIKELKREALSINREKTQVTTFKRGFKFLGTEFRKIYTPET